MVDRNNLIEFINRTLGQDILDQAEKNDEMANGIQFYGSQEVKKVVLGTSLNEDFLKEAIAAQANFCIFHHGFDPRTYKSLYCRSSQKRLKLILKNNLTIAAYHYALDVHPQIGNNATIINHLGAKLDQPFFEGWGYTGIFAKPQDVKKLSRKCAEIFEHDVFAVYSGPKKVTTIGVCSGGAKPSSQHLAEMEAKGVELFITGETTESAPHKMKESAINYFVCGHYATEVFGVQELGKKIKAEFKDKLKVEFIDIPSII